MLGGCVADWIADAGPDNRKLRTALASRLLSEAPNFAVVTTSG
jgi:hypothetical protein